MFGRQQLSQYVTPADPDWHIDSWKDSGGKETKRLGGAICSTTEFKPANPYT